MRFTDKGIAALKAGTDRYEEWEDGRTGFGIRVSPTGRKSWILMYRFGGKARRMTLGNYPTVGLASARVALANAKKTLDHGEDPGAAAKSEKLAAQQAPTVKELVDEYLTREASKRRSHKEIKRVLEKEIVATWGRRKAATIKRRDVILLLDGIVDRGAAIAGNRTLAYVRRMFNFGIARDILADNPCWGVEAPGDETERKRVLTDDEVRALWEGLSSSAHVTPAARIAIKLILVTAQRPGEVAGIEMAEVDLDDGRTWTLPSRRTKNGVEHTVPLSPLAVDLIREAIAVGGRPAEAKWLFPSPTGDGPITRRALTQMFSRNRADLGLQSDASGPATPHDLRRTAATRMTELGFTRFIVDRVLNHVEPGVGRVYDRHTYVREKRLALEAWALRLQEIITGKISPDAKVVSLRTA